MSEQVDRSHGIASQISVAILATRIGSRHPSSLTVMHQEQRGPAGAPFFVDLAERVGFEPTVDLRPRLISSQVHSTALPPLRWQHRIRGLTAALNPALAAPPHPLVTTVSLAATLVDMTGPAPAEPVSPKHLQGMAVARCLLCIFLLLLTGCFLFEDNKLRAVKSARELVVLTSFGPTTYFENPEGPAGFEYDLAKAFADHLGVRLRVAAVRSFSEVLPRLLNGEADFAASGITITEARRAMVRFTPPYQHVRQQVVYRRGATRPADVAALADREIEVRAGTSYVDRLTELKQEYPDLTWTEVDDRETEDLLQAVWEGLLDITVADSNIVAVNQQYFPELQVAFDLNDSEGLGWAFPPGPDNSLYDEAVRFLESARTSGELANLIERYYGAASRSGYVNMTVYQLRVQTRLPEYQSLFEAAGKQTGLDWRLLAAIGYQESFWDPKAISPTGVRGMMMLTEETAKQLDVVNRLDARQSIIGGAQYMAQLIERIPATVSGPDRLWMALAAYNVGPYHLEDARTITQRQKADPNKWLDVKDRLPLLSRAKWAKAVPYGYARGSEAVIFVNRVRAYYDVLVKLDEEERARRGTEALKLNAPAL
jgi:membrane-bound lytic murein transglycosylase F